ncbi:MAG: DUF4055 domain-containing protein [Vicinamibacterales bacterium]
MAMKGITTPRSECTGQAMSRWTRCRDVYEGGDAVKAAGTRYLPKLSGQSATAYEAYKTRALFYNGFARTVQGLVGAVFRKDPDVKAPGDILETWATDVTRTGVPFTGAAMLTLEEVLKVGRFGAYVDMPESAPAGAVPYIVPVLAERIVNWSTAVRDGRRILTRVIIRETVEEPNPAEPFHADEVEQYRELRLSPEGRYEVQVYRRANRESAEWAPHGPAITPIRRGEPLKDIPFQFFGPTSLEAAVQKPPLLDLVDVNLSHYRTSADLEHGRHYCGLPQPWVAGYRGEDKLRIGSSVAWVFDDPQAKADYLEFTGQGLGELKDALKEKQDQMAILGARMLEGQKPGVEAAETVKLRSAGDSATLKSIAVVTSLGLSQLLRWVVWWAGVDAPDDETTVTLNTDFFGLKMSSDEVKAAMLLWQAGAKSWDDLFFLLQEGGWARPGISAEEELALINADRGDEVTPPPSTTPPTPPPADAGAGA